MNKRRNPSCSSSNHKHCSVLGTRLIQSQTLFCLGHSTHPITNTVLSRALDSSNHKHCSVSGSRLIQSQTLFCLGHSRPVTPNTCHSQTFHDSHSSTKKNPRRFRHDDRELFHSMMWLRFTVSFTPSPTQYRHHLNLHNNYLHVSSVYFHFCSTLQQQLHKNQTRTINDLMLTSRNVEITPWLASAYGAGHCSPIY